MTTRFDTVMWIGLLTTLAAWLMWLLIQKPVWNYVHLLTLLVPSASFIAILFIKQSPAKDENRNKENKTVKGKDDRPTVVNDAQKQELQRLIASANELEKSLKDLIAKAQVRESALRAVLQRSRPSEAETAKEPKTS